MAVALLCTILLASCTASGSPVSSDGSDTSSSVQCILQQLQPSSHSAAAPTSSLLQTLHNLRNTIFFRIFKVNLYNRPCEFWHEEHQCMEIGCSVCGQCSEEDLPVEWRNYPQMQVQMQQQQETLDNVTALQTSASFVNPHLSSAVRQWREESGCQWVEDEVDHCEAQAIDVAYIDVSLNPEGYTGYEGQLRGARSILLAAHT